MDAIRLHVARGGYLLGACNGFQIVVEAGLLPGALLRNASLRFLAMDCYLRVERAVHLRSPTNMSVAKVGTRGEAHEEDQLLRPMTQPWIIWMLRAWSRSAMSRPQGRLLRRQIETAAPAISPGSTVRTTAS